MKKVRFAGILLVLFGIAIILTGIACADQGVAADPETQAFTTTTTFNADGLVTETDAVAWTLTNLSLGNIPPLDENQIVYTTVYDSNIVAQGGKTTMVKTMSVDTRNKVISQSNIRAETEAAFVPTADGGNIVGSENIMIDGAADLIEDAGRRILCPFVSGIDGVIPAYCNIVQAGSRYDLTIGSVATSADDRFVSNDASNPVVLNYQINVKPYGSSQGMIPAEGMATAYVKTHVQEAREWDQFLPESGLMHKAEDLTYSETSSAQGTITAFTKQIQYSSQVNSVASVPLG